MPSHRSIYHKLAFLMGFVAWGLIFNSALASPIVFDLEDQAQTGFNGGALTSLTLTHPQLSMTITRPGAPSQFDIYDVNDIENATFPGDWGVRSISPWYSNAGTAFVANFDRPVRSVSIDMGDFGGDPDDLFIEAYSGIDAAGMMVQSATAMLPEGGSAFTEATLTVAAPTPEIWSVRFRGGTESFSTPFGTFSIPNSVYYDNFTIAVPEPTTGVMLLLAMIGGLSAVRRRS